MGSLKRSCLRWALLYVVLGALFSAAVYIRFPKSEAALPAGFVAAIPAWLGLAYLQGAKLREARLIAGGIRGGKPADGEKVGVVGVVGAASDMVVSPLGKKRCVLYEYKLLPPANQAAGAYEGFHLSSVRIDGPRGSIRVLAYPELAFPTENLGSQQHYDNALEYIGRTTFTEPERSIKGAIGHLTTAMADDDGKIHYDIRDATNTVHLDRMRLQEKVIAPGEAICAIGRYSASRGGLVTDPGAVLHPVKITKGEPAAVLRKLRTGAAFDTLLGFGCLTPVVLAAAIFLVVLPLTAIEQIFPDKDPSWTEIRLEEILKSKVRPAVARWFTLPDADVTIPLEIGQASGKFSAGDVSARLLVAIGTREEGATEVSILGEGAPAPGLILRIGDDDRIQSLQVIGGPTIRQPDAKIEDVRRFEDEIRGRVTYLSPDLRLRTAFRAAVQ